MNVNAKNDPRCGAVWALSRMVLPLIVFGLAALSHGTETKGEEMSYGEVREFIAKHTNLVELSDPGGARVAVCPEWQGRVMTSSCGGNDGTSFGFVNRGFVEWGQLDKRFNNYGAEDRMWLSPEGGRFSLWFAPGAEQTLDHWYTADNMNNGAYELVAPPDSSTCRMKREMKLQNASGTQFDFAVTRDVRLLGTDDLASLFGEAAGLMQGDDVKLVAYETANSISNNGPAMTREGGLVSIWMLGMLNAGPETVIVVPYRPGDESELGPVVKSDYFGEVPAERLKVLPEAILFRADAKFRAKIGTSQRRAKNVLGSIDFAAGTLTIVQFTMPDDPTKHDYMNNMWGFDTPAPYVGDVANAYNDGPPEPGGEAFGSFYEIESLSPAAALATGESLTHCHRTLHLQAEPEKLDAISRAVFGIGLDAVRQAMLDE